MKRENKCKAGDRAAVANEVTGFWWPTRSTASRVRRPKRSGAARSEAKGRIVSVARRGAQRADAKRRESANQNPAPDEVWASGRGLQDTRQICIRTCPQGLWSNKIALSHRLITKATPHGDTYDHPAAIPFTNFQVAECPPDDVGRLVNVPGNRVSTHGLGPGGCFGRPGGVLPTRQTVLVPLRSS
jgi:hypothetical protein